MNHLHHPRIRGRILAGAVVVAAGLLGGATAAQAAVPCELTPATGSATQTDTTVTGGLANDTIDCRGASPGKTITGGFGNDTITGTAEADTISGNDGNDTLTGGDSADILSGGLGIDTLNGDAGDDNLVGPSVDGRQDSLFAGIGNDTCQGPAPDPDIHDNCENTSLPPIAGPGSGAANATELCQASGGTFSLTLMPVGYTCVFLTPDPDHRIPEARNICTNRGGTFTDADLVYTCVLPLGTQTVRITG
jgi:hypothetical protein